MKTNKLTTIACAIACIVSALSPEMILAQVPQEVVAGSGATKDKDRDLKFIESDNDGYGSIFFLNARPKLTIPGESFFWDSQANAILKDKYMPAKIFREVFTYSELSQLANLKNSISVGVTFDPSGKIIDIGFTVFHKGNAQIRRILNPDKLKELYIKLRDRLLYTMPNPNSNLRFYGVIFNVKFTDILRNAPLLTN